LNVHVKSVPELLSCPCIVVAEAELAHFQAIDLAGISLLSMRVGAAGITLTLGGLELPSGTVPMLCLGFLAVEPETLKLLENVRQSFEHWSGMAFPVPVLVQPSGTLDLLLASSLVQREQTIAAYATRLARELALLRSAHENLQNNFAKAETLISQADIAQASLRFINPPGATATGVDRQAIRQTLPVSSFGLAALDLHIAKPGAGLSLHLYTLEDHQLQASWQLEADACPAGWVSLVLPAGLAGLARTPELVITPLGGFGVLPELSFGAPQPLGRFQAVVDGTARPASLALRCWAGLPGVKLANPGAAPQADALVTEIRLPPGLRAMATRVRGPWQTEWPIVRDMPEKNGVLCHPPPGDVNPPFTAALIEGLTADRPLRISAKGVVGDARAAPVEFALAAAPPGVDVPALLAEGEGGFSFSGWQAGDFTTPAFIALQVPPQALRQNLFLFTRMADGAVNHYAQACFEEMRIAFLGPPQAEPTRAVPVPEAVLRRVENPLDPADKSVMYKEYEQALLCHPMPKGVKLGCLPHLVPPGALGVSAQVKLGHAEAWPVQFALAVSALPGAAVLAHLETGHPGIALTPWLQVQVGESAGLEVAADHLPPMPEAASLYLLTRMAPEAPNADCAWAYFQDIMLIMPAQAVA